MVKEIHCLYQKIDGTTNIIACHCSFSEASEQLKELRKNGTDYFLKTTLLLGEEEHVQSNNTQQT